MKNKLNFSNKKEVVKASIIAIIIVIIISIIFICFISKNTTTAPSSINNITSIEKAQNIFLNTVGK